MLPTLGLIRLEVTAESQTELFVIICSLVLLIGDIRDFTLNLLCEKHMLYH